jgi:hypothetical protein
MTITSTPWLPAGRRALTLDPDAPFETPTVDSLPYA